MCVQVLKKVGWSLFLSLISRNVLSVYIISVGRVVIVSGGDYMHMS